MNAPRSKEEILAHLTAELATDRQAKIDALQPNVADCLRPLIASGVEFNEMRLDFYGQYFKGEGYLVEGVTLQGHKIDLYALFTASQIADFGAACDRFNDRDEEAEAEFARDEARAMSAGEY